MTIFDWPANLTPADVLLKPPRKTVGNKSLSEVTQVVPSIRPPFSLSLRFDILGGDQVIAYRALLASLEGRANTVRVPLFDVFRASNAQIGAGAVTHSDGTAFSDGALYLTDDLSGVTVTGAQGQRNITVDFGEYGQLLQGGLYFGLGDRPYIATAVWWEGSVAKIRCSPTLRQNYIDEPLKLKPTMLGFLPDDDAGEHLLRRGLWAAPTIDLEEDFRVTLP
ncbi:hypothetical protein [Pelagerythrobacter marinus]|uniref:hypothetical protein n=1 Tax=Pelagerythrobacter marinus TaxID=538382 RepID=UPI002AC8E51E|nr:hypothetical protein [Pelagerythrobacter marinus]WPZ06571.1 hypothetical protein T8T98_14335 [Pelagerythrobacter marinus]